jgi:hypothetical protein
MSHVSWRGFSPGDHARSTDRAITAHTRLLATALLSSLCLMSCFAAAAQAAPQPQHDAGAARANAEFPTASTDRSLPGAIMAGAATSALAATQGCPSGYVCIYPENTGWNGGVPSLRYYRYGAHNLSGQYGIHRVFNNQTGGAWVGLCTGYNGGGTCWWIRAGEYWDVNLTPINSIVLSP